MSNEAVAPAVPRPAATVLIVRDDPFEVLIVRRSAASSFLPDNYVFPGGRVEEHDRSPLWLSSIEQSGELDAEERAFRIAAVRETHEEASILLADGLVAELADGRVDGSSGRVVAVPQPAPDAVAFRELIVSLGVRLLLDEVVPWAHWITPAVSPKRFDTRFYLTRAPEGQLAQADAAETEDAQWMSPAEAVERAREGSLALSAPSFINLSLLAESSDTEQAMAQARRRPIIPVLPYSARSADGVTRLQIPTEAGYGVSEYEIPQYTRSAEPQPPSSR